MSEREARTRPALEVLVVALRLGLTSFGGPIAHLGYFREEYVVRRRWLDDRRFADLVALCHFLPGPASSQVGIAVGTIRAGPLGGLMAWLGFTLPSAVALLAFALLVGSGTVAGAGWLHGLGLVAVAVVAAAVLAMARSLTPDARRLAIALLAAAVLVAWHSPLAQVAVLAGGAVLGLLLVAPVPVAPGARDDPVPISRVAALVSLTLFAALLVALPVLAAASGSRVVAVVDAFYSAGALVFGGGHVVLPLLSERIVDPGWLDAERFLAGYGAAQAVPGPLFTVAAYLGAAMPEEPNGVAGGLLAVWAIFLPSFLLVFGVLPFWAGLRRIRGATQALAGTNAAVVGLLAGALYTPIGTTAVRSIADAAVVAVAFALLVVARVPPWLVVAGGALAGSGLAALGVG